MEYIKKEENRNEKISHEIRNHIRKREKCNNAIVRYH